MGNKFDRYFFEEIPCHRAFNKKIYGRVVNTINIWETVDEKMWGNTEGKRMILDRPEEGKIYLVDRTRIVEDRTDICTCSKGKDHEDYIANNDIKEQTLGKLEKGNEGMMIPVLFMGLLMVSASMVLKKK